MLSYPGKARRSRDYKEEDGWNMKLWKKLAAVLLALVLVVSLCACDNSPEKKLYGTWTYEMDLASLIDQAMEEELGESIAVDAELKLPMVFTFNKDKTFTLEVSKEDLKSGFGTYLEALKDAVVEMMYQQAEEMGLSRENFDQAFAATYESTVEEYCDELMDSLVDDSLFEDMTTNWAGTYRVRDDRLYVADTEEELSEDVYLTYTLEADTLSICAVEGSALELDDLGTEFPMDFVRQTAK